MKTTESMAIVFQQLQQLSGDKNWFSYDHVLLYLLSRKPFVPFVLVNAVDVEQIPTVVAAGAFEYCPEEVAVIVLNGAHWTYAIKPSFARAKSHIPNPIIYSDSFVTFHRVAEVGAAAKICMEVNDAANIAE